jgi:hypothetical protein
LIERAESVKTDVDKVVSIDVGTDEWRTAMDAILGKIDALDSLIDERSSLLRGLAGGEA